MAAPVTAAKRYLGYLNWVFNPFHGLDVSGVYELLAKTSATRNGLYLNLGYWREASTIESASEALAMLVADTAQMSADDAVVDCGFGFADQDLLWARRRSPRRIIGLNVTRSQVDVGRERVAAEGLADRIDLRQASATDMPIESASVDVVVALESAFHFDTREDFFREAERVLRPGGRLVTADIIPAARRAGVRERLRQRLSWYLVASKFRIPSANAYGQDAYRQRLAQAGFEAVELCSIRDHVYAPLHRFIGAHPDRLARLHPVARIPARATLRRDAESVYAGLDYVLASARKPHVLF